MDPSGQRTSGNRLSPVGDTVEHHDHDNTEAHPFHDELDAMEGGHAHEEGVEEGVDPKLDEELQHGGRQFYEPALDGTYPIKKLKPMKSKKRGDKKPMLRSWLAITSSGETSVLQADKYKLTARLGIQTRDLRLLDPQMSNTYPSAILCRDKSIVVNLEHIKVIITMDRVLVVNYEDEGNAKFVEDLKQRIMYPTMAASKSFPSGADLQRMERLAHHFAKAPGTGLPTIAMSAQLPFELRVLEVCLDELASEYDVQTTELESITYPALDSLAAKVTSPNLEKVRRLKNRLVRLTTRVETVREVLEKFLDDDEDMHDLNLTANNGGVGGVLGVGGGGSQGPGGEECEDGLLDGGDRDSHHPLHRAASGPLPGQDHHAFMAKRLSIRSSASSASTDSSVMESEVAEVEMLLEAYFMHFDNTYNRLTTLNEYIKDTEDLVNIKLDQHRNQLITTDLILTAFTCAMAMVTTIAGIFGMNLDSGLQEEEGVFNQVTIASCVGALSLFVMFVVWAWRYGLLVFN